MHYRLEALMMPGWTTRRHLTAEELEAGLASAHSDPLVRKIRYKEDTPPGTWVTEFPEGAHHD